MLNNQAELYRVPHFGCTSSMHIVEKETQMFAISHKAGTPPRTWHPQGMRWSCFQIKRGRGMSRTGRTRNLPNVKSVSESDMGSKEFTAKKIIVSFWRRRRRRAPEDNSDRISRSMLYFNCSNLWISTLLERFDRIHSCGLPAGCIRMAPLTCKKQKPTACCEYRCRCRDAGGIAQPLLCGARPVDRTSLLHLRAEKRWSIVECMRCGL